MSTFTFNNPLKNKRLQGAIQGLLPWRFRRMLVLSGAYGLISSMEGALRSHASELSQVMQLSRDPQSIEVPITFHSVLVSKFNDLNVMVQGKNITLAEAASRTLNDEERLALAEVMARNVSPILRYSRISCMAEDIKRLLGFVESKRTA